MTEPSPHAELLIVADQKAGALYAVHPPTAQLVQQHTHTVLAEHAGFLPLPRDRLAYVDDAAGELVVLDVFAAHWRAASVSVAIPAEHIAASPDGRFVAITTGLGVAENPWSDLVTVVDLTGERPAGRRIRCRTGEPGVVIGHDRTDPSARPVLVLRHREPGALESFAVDDVRTAPAHCPVMRGKSASLPDDGHGDAYDPLTGTIFTATSAGVYRHTLRDGGAVLTDILPWTVPGRAYFLRFCPRDRTLFAVVRGGDPNPQSWHRWTNSLWRYSVDTNEISVLALGTGLVFRLALTHSHAVVARVHPHGDETVSVRRHPAEPLTEVGRSPLPAMTDAPVPGREPWDGTDRRAIAAAPHSEAYAVTRGGHGELHLLDASAPAAPARTVRLPTALREGGHLAWVQRGFVGGRDTVGR
ncbi:hypothetical protein [Cryobacterium sp. PH29-G1]|uniref:hypothetical protein n=1 Tax=Cryobacterium sp. PH29-G1 TaxID=3046211 RepID=UPI0024BB7C23|nr:hypothetical protein [Cryobacterium sp. PH29-G1]MDJ0350250.1 hypothetical protein [Cryobacterium sp. PH29-G1]